jgi:hypothetical protein
MKKQKDKFFWKNSMAVELKSIMTTIFGADRYNYTTQMIVDEEDMSILEFDFQHLGFPYCRNITMKLLPVVNRVEIDKVGTDGQTMSLNIDEADKQKTLEWYRTIKQSFGMSSMVHDAIEMKRHINQKEWSITSMTESGTPSRYTIEAQRNGMALINLHRDYSDKDNSATYKEFGYGNGGYVSNEYGTLDEALQKVYEYTTPSRIDVIHAIMERVYDVTGENKKDVKESSTAEPEQGFIEFKFKKSLLYDQISFDMENRDRKISIFRLYVTPDGNPFNDVAMLTCDVCAPYDVASIESAVKDIVGLQGIVMYLWNYFLPAMYPLTMSQVIDTANTNKIYLKVHNLEKDEARLEFACDDKTMLINYLDGNPSNAIVLRAEDITTRAVLDAIDILMTSHNVKRIDEA